MPPPLPPLPCFICQDCRSSSPSPSDLHPFQPLGSPIVSVAFAGASLHVPGKLRSEDSIPKARAGLTSPAREHGPGTPCGDVGSHSRAPPVLLPFSRLFPLRCRKTLLQCEAIRNEGEDHVSLSGLRSSSSALAWTLPRLRRLEHAQRRAPPGRSERSSGHASHGHGGGDPHLRY